MRWTISYNTQYTPFLYVGKDYAKPNYNQRKANQGSATRGKTWNKNVFLVYKVRSVVDLPHEVGSSKMDKAEVMRATNCCNLQVEKRYVARITTHLANIVTQQTDFVVASWSSMLHRVELASTFCNNKFCCVTMFARWVVIRPKMLFNLQRNNVALQVAAICSSYYFTFKCLGIWIHVETNLSVNVNIVGLFGGKWV